MYNDSIIFFGTADISVAPAQYSVLSNTSLQNAAPFCDLMQKLALSDLIFLRQTHSVNGYEVTAPMPSFTQEGDYLITNTPGIGLGVMTADCTPVIAIDEKRKAVGIAHAGWRGALAGIVPAMLAHMAKVYGTRYSDLKITIGPSARGCCYQVQPDFMQHIGHATHALSSRAHTFFFDVPTFIQEQLDTLSIYPENIDTQQAVCTICNPAYCSYRRAYMLGGPQAAEATKRQMTIVGLGQ